MGQRETRTLALREPVSNPTADGKARWNATTVDGKERVTIFDEKLYDAFLKAELAGKEHAYVLQPDGNGKWPPLLIEIPDVYEKKRGGGGGSRPMFTDRQVALLAAAINNTFPDVDQYLAWLGGGGTLAGPRQSTTTGRAEPPSPPAGPLKATRVQVDAIRVKASERGVLESTIRKTYRVNDLEDLTVEQAEEALNRLTPEPQRPQAGSSVPAAPDAAATVSEAAR